MNMSLGLSLYAISGTSVFNPATLSLTGWWRGSYSASPWVGTASAGSSGSNNLTEATTPPASGTAVNGFNPADFDGSNDQLVGAAMSTYISASAYLWWALFYSEATGGSGNVTTGYTNPGLWSDQATWIGSGFWNDSGTEKIVLWHYDGTTRVGNTHAIALNAWNLICVRYDGTNIRSRLNSGSVTVSGSVGSVGNITNTFYMGRNYDGSACWNGRVLSHGFMSSAESDARFDNIKSYINARYALSL